MTARHECPAGGETIAVEIRGVYDGALFYGCTVCTWTEHRWDAVTAGHLHALARKHMLGWVEQRTVEATR